MAAQQRDSGAQVPLTDNARSGWASGSRVSGGGSAQALPMTDEQKEQVEQRERPAFGFRP